ncbi:50S ribosomal protein L32 [Borreliella yangtzensis]|uniref:50S ribosomal protein L32 n=1 Tax=Borreliella yangtzensis TaxID=683292 RepID=UPI002647EB02|nr:50S ribosomal protein L32 [Borreliella yangtzensis]WKC75489.1 50S ribosomal protein L32 [Borreliella yangtzensis]
MAVPKFKPSKSRSRTRRSINMRKKIPQFQECSNCGSLGVRHRICLKCGYYRNNQYLEIGL